MSEILYLGHIVGKDGIKPNPKIIQSIEEWKVPCNMKEVQQFIGLCNYYRKFIFQFSDIASPLSQLTRKDNPFEWADACQESFQKLRSALTSRYKIQYFLWI